MLFNWTPMSLPYGLNDESIVIAERKGASFSAPVREIVSSGRTRHWGVSHHQHEELGDSSILSRHPKLRI